MLLVLELLTTLMQGLIIFREKRIAGKHSVKSGINCGYRKREGGVIQSSVYDIIL